MALYEGYNKIQGSRSNTALVKSGHMSPAEDWMVDPKICTASENLKSVFADGYLFRYEYGGAGMEDVVIPKGRVVGVAAPVKDFVTKQYKTTMTLPGLATNNNVIGVVPYNITKQYTQQDRFGGNQPSIITLEYITLPYMAGVNPSTDYSAEGVYDEENRISKGLNMPWGAVLGKGVVEGDYLKASPSGRLVKWNKGTDNFCDVVGQVLATDYNAEPWGWFKWMLRPEELRDEADEFINRSGASNLPSDSGYPFDPEYIDGNHIFQQYQSGLVSNPTGIPGLHDGSGTLDGYGINDTIQIFTKESFFKGNESAGSDIGLCQLLDANGEKVKNLETILSVKIGSHTLTTEEYSVDYAKGQLFIPYDDKYSNSEIEVQYKKKFYGTPSYIDFKGVVGSLFILLKR